MRPSIIGISFMTLLLFPLLHAQTGSALLFSNASSTYVQVPYTDTLQPTGAVTMEAWLQVNSWSGTPGIAGNTEFGGYELEIEQFGGVFKLNFWLRRNGNYGMVSITQSQFGSGWHHVAGTYDGRMLRMYLDGVKVDSNDAGGVYPIQYAHHNGFIIGAEAYSGPGPFGNYFNGAVDDLRVWNYARSADSIAAARTRTLSGNESGLAGYWPFDEGSGSVAHDQTAFHQHGTLYNNPTWISHALPVELTAFTARRNGEGVQLHWNTATETDNYGFDVERRPAALPVNGSMHQSSNESMVSWSSLGFVPGNGTSNISHEYQFTDRVTAGGRCSYRLRQLDRSGAFHYSAEVTVEASVPAASGLEQNYPNPFNPATAISYQLSERGATTLRVFDALGRQVADLVNEVKEPGTYSVRFDASGLASGIYFSVLQTPSARIVRKMQLLK